MITMENVGFPYHERTTNKDVQEQVLNLIMGKVPASERLICSDHDNRKCLTNNNFINKYYDYYYYLQIYLKER